MRPRPPGPVSGPPRREGRWPAGADGPGGHAGAGPSAALVAARGSAPRRDADRHPGGGDPGGDPRQLRVPSAHAGPVRAGGGGRRRQGPGAALAPGRHRVQPGPRHEDPQAAAAADVLDEFWIDRTTERANAALQRKHSWPPEWLDERWGSAEPQRYITPAEAARAAGSADGGAGPLTEIATPTRRRGRPAPCRSRSSSLSYPLLRPGQPARAHDGRPPAGERRGPGERHAAQRRTRAEARGPGADPEADAGNTDQEKELPL